MSLVEKISAHSLKLFFSSPKSIVLYVDDLNNICRKYINCRFFRYRCILEFLISFHGTSVLQCLLFIHWEHTDYVMRWVRSFFIANATDTNVRKIILPGNTTNSQMHHDLTRSECFLAFCTKYCPVIHKSAKVCWANGFLTGKRLLFTVFTSAVCFNLLDHHTNLKSINIHHQFFKIWGSIWYMSLPLPPHSWKGRCERSLIRHRKSSKICKFGGVLQLISQTINCNGANHPRVNLNRHVGTVQIIRGIPVLSPRQFEFFKEALSFFYPVWTPLKITFYRRISKNHTDARHRAGNKKKLSSRLLCCLLLSKPSTVGKEAVRTSSSERRVSIVE